MARHISSDEALAAMRTRAQLLREGWRPRDIGRALSSARIRRVQRNRYVEESFWLDLWPESRHLLEVNAAASEMRDGEAAAAYESAGVLHRMPLYRHSPGAVHVTLPQGTRASSRSGLARHRDALPDEDLTVLDGIRCTTLERTTFDIARSLSREAAVAFADAALRKVAMRGTSYDTVAAEGWRERMLDRAARGAGLRGVRQAIEVIRFADGRADLPGESVTRLQLARLGFTRFGLQVVVPAPSGGEYRVDLELEEMRTLLEFDGYAKYLDEALRSGKPLADVLLDEKRREDWIRGRTQKRLVRVEDAHIASPNALAARLLSFGIPLPS
ncbi:hypothetical protein AAIB33_11310 [Microbacterium sp. AZCO]|uniref:hypothetical protein n=1 Tax=Microbacterium sp. AZCO TaxID=3142976 RepID=UPI0031F3E44D